MCGIAGIISTEKLDHHYVSAMVNSLTHRGPDANGIFISKSEMVFFGHTRLSIIDVSVAANQPFYSRDTRYVVVFNGEIYNFKLLRDELIKDHGIKFSTHSDTEVIVEAFAVWGENIASKLQGMFSIAIFDQKLDITYFFRDRVGKKPLFYFQSEKLFAFASEIKSLLVHPYIRSQIKTNREVIGTILHLGYIPEPATIYTNIYKFPSGFQGKIDMHLNLELKPYWKVDDTLNVSKLKSPDIARQKFHALLNNAVKDRLISDVPLGAFLSGGTDSSLVSAVASRHMSKPLKTFSIGFKENKFDESRYARDVARHLGTDHCEYVLAEKDGSDILQTYLRHFDEPFADTSAIPTMLVSKLARNEVTVALTGDGGDELFQGYGAYSWANRLNNPGIKTIRRPLKLLLEWSGKSRFERIAHMLNDIKIGGQRSHIFSQEQYFFSQSEIINDLILNKDEFKVFEYNEAYLTNKNLTPGEKQALFDFKYYLKDDLLVKVDRASMYYALECRSPLLDHRIVEFSFSLDSSLKRRSGTPKWILKDLLKEYLPEKLIDRPKWGFSIPLSKWLKNDLHYLIEEYLNDKIIDQLGWFKVTYVRHLCSQFMHGKDYLFNRLWVLIVVQKWLKENSDNG